MATEPLPVQPVSERTKLLEEGYEKLDERAFFPRDAQAGPYEQGVEVRVPTRDEAAEISCCLIENFTNTKIVICFHGNGELVESYVRTIEMHCKRRVQAFLDAKLNVFVCEYRGYGKSTGTPSFKTFYSDTEVCFEYLTTVKNIPPQDIIVWGRSTGSLAAIYLASKYQVGGMILDSFLPLPSVCWCDPIDWDPTFIEYARTQLFCHKARTQQIKCPVFICACLDDMGIGNVDEYWQWLVESSAESETMYEADTVTNEKGVLCKLGRLQFLHLTTGGHQYIWAMNAEYYEECLVSFFDEWVPRPKAKAKGSSGCIIL